MCGRYAFDDAKDIYEARRILDEISSRLGSGAAEAVKTGEVFPGDCAAALLLHEGTPAADVLGWGYPLKGTKRLVINARAETAHASLMFKKSAVSKRCLVACTGFFEWKKEEGRSVKYEIGLKGERLFYLGGLYDEFVMEGERKKRFVILTGAADGELARIHPRTPLIVTPAAAGEWLSGASAFERFFAAPKEYSIRAAR